MKTMAIRTMSKISTLKEIMMYFHIFPFDFWEDCPLGFEFSCDGGSRDGGCGAGAGGGEFFFLSFGTAGKEPLLRVVGRAMICPVGTVPVTGAAGRLLACASSLRRAKTMFDSNKPA